MIFMCSFSDSNLSFSSCSMVNISYVNEDGHDLGWGHWKKGEVGHISIDESWPNRV